LFTKGLSDQNRGNIKREENGETEGFYIKQEGKFMRAHLYICPAPTTFEQTDGIDG
jgi:hypothetical protein